MKVIVNTSGFYAGTWHSASPKSIDMPDIVAKQFLPPYGDELSLAKAERAAAAAEKKAG
jgi:hypothetical protein